MSVVSFSLLKSSRFVSRSVISFLAFLLFGLAAFAPDCCAIRKEDKYTPIKVKTELKTIKGFKSVVQLTGGLPSQLVLPPTVHQVSNDGLVGPT